MTLVVGYDGTEGAKAALAEALALAGDLGEDVHLVFSFLAPRVGGELRDLDEVIQERGRLVLAEATAGIAATVAVTSEVRRQDVADGLAAAADERDARMIVVGSYGERPLKTLLVGATPTRLMHMTRRPILVVRAPAED
jgi:nucleotide-binding universal stress UspA family protein